MRMHLVYLLILVGIISCNTYERTNSEFEVVEYDVDRIIVENRSIINYELTSSSLQYCFKENECESYLINQDGNGSYITVKGDTVELLLVKKGDYIINDKIYSISKFLSGQSKIDGELQHYWSYDFGIVLVKSTTWHGLKILKNNNDDDLSTLVLILMNDVTMMNVKEVTTEEEINSNIDSLINVDL